MSLVRRLLPISRAGMALWAWRHRAQVADAVRFVARAAPKVVSGDTSDAVAEARLRAKLMSHGTTRDAELVIDVTDGVARLGGRASEKARTAAVAAARSIPGITRVVDTSDPVRRRLARR